MALLIWSCPHETTHNSIVGQGKMTVRKSKAITIPYATVMAVSTAWNRIKCKRDFEQKLAELVQDRYVLSSCAWIDIFPSLLVSNTNLYRLAETAPYLTGFCLTPMYLKKLSETFNCWIDILEDVELLVPEVRKWAVENILTAVERPFIPVVGEAILAALIEVSACQKRKDIALQKHWKCVIDVLVHQMSKGIKRHQQKKEQRMRSSGSSCLTAMESISEETTTTTEEDSEESTTASLLEL